MLLIHKLLPDAVISAPGRFQPQCQETREILLSRILRHLLMVAA